MIETRRDPCWVIATGKLKIRSSFFSNLSNWSWNYTYVYSWLHNSTSTSIGLKLSTRLRRRSAGTKLISGTEFSSLSLSDEKHNLFLNSSVYVRTSTYVRIHPGKIAASPFLAISHVHASRRQKKGRKDEERWLCEKTKSLIRPDQAAAFPSAHKFEREFLKLLLGFFSRRRWRLCFVYGIERRRERERERER